MTVAAVVVLRTLTAADRGAVEAMTRDTGFFHEDEVPVALEVFDAAVAGTSDYLALGAEVNGAWPAGSAGDRPPARSGPGTLLDRVDPPTRAQGSARPCLAKWSSGSRAARA